MSTQPTSPTTPDPKLLEGVAYFENMLKVLPGDRTALEFLAVAYGQLDDLPNRRKALVGLANVLLAEHDLDAAAQIAEHLAQFSEPDAQAAILRIQAATAQDAPSSPLPVPQSLTPAPTAVRCAVKSELDLVKQLVRAKIITDALADSVMQHLTPLAEAPGRTLISAMSVLEREEPALWEKAVEYLADEYHTPPVDLSAFDPNPELAQNLPESIACVRGVLPFAKLDKTLLVAILNPSDPELRNDVRDCLETECRFFIASPQLVEPFLEKIWSAPETPPGESPQ